MTRAAPFSLKSPGQPPLLAVVAPSFPAGLARADLSPGRLPAPLRKAAQALTLLAGDVAAFAVLAPLALAGPGALQNRGAYAAMVLAWLLWFGVAKGAYTGRRPWWAELQQLTRRPKHPPRARSSPS